MINDLYSRIGLRLYVSALTQPHPPPLPTTTNKPTPILSLSATDRRMDTPAGLKSLSLPPMQGVIE